MSRVKQTLKDILDKVGLLEPIQSFRIAQRNKALVAAWEEKGRPAPPPHTIKQQTVKAYAKQYQTAVFVETGTYTGDMVAAVKNTFDRIYSIELGRELFLNAQKRFASRPSIKIINGDSGKEIQALVKTLEQPALFWLDAHYSAGITARGDIDTPIYAEVEAILDSPQRGHVILIDDVHAFGTEADYPTLDELFDFVRARRNDLHIAVEDNIIRITPLESSPRRQRAYA